MTNKKLGISLIIAFNLAAPLSIANAQSGGLIIPMPGEKQIEKAKETIKQSGKSETKKGNSDKGTLIPLPATIKPSKQKSPANSPETTTSNEASPLIIIPKPNEPKASSDNVDMPTIPGEVVIEPESLNPPVDLPKDATIESSDAVSVSSNLPIFPKDTSSALFMVMKTWQCNNYDGNTLITHAVEVYGQDSGESFEIKGLSPDQPFMLDLDEEDITLDELLDLISLKTGRDWGADVPGRTIYFYPKGVNTDSAGTW